MLQDEIKGYVKEIETENAEKVYDKLYDIFGDVLDEMTPDSVVYGGAVRDALAGKEILGDLDILVPPNRSQATNIIMGIKRSGKWSEIKGDAKENPSGEYKELSISKVYSFENRDGKIVQVISLKSQVLQSSSKRFREQGTPLNMIISEVSKVDIRCCGVAMLCDGLVVEAVEGAYIDCINGELNLNENPSTISYFANIDARVKKLEARGWTSNIPTEKIQQLKKEAEERLEKAKAAAKEASSENYKESCPCSKCSRIRAERDTFHTATATEGHAFDSMFTTTA